MVELFGNHQVFVAPTLARVSWPFCFDFKKLYSQPRLPVGNMDLNVDVNVLFANYFGIFAMIFGLIILLRRISNYP